MVLFELFKAAPLQEVVFSQKNDFWDKHTKMLPKVSSLNIYLKKFSILCQ
jgi:hypothetical protein